MSVLTGEYFVPQIAQITQITRIRSAGGLCGILFTRKTRMGTEVRKRTLWVNGNCHQLDSN